MAYLLDEKHIAYSNHTYMDLHGAMALAMTLPESKAYKVKEFVREKFDILLRKQFDANGVHCENSPQYQGFALARLKNLLMSKWFDEFGLPDISKKIEKILSLMYQPNGQLIPIGDTDGNCMTTEKVFGDITKPELHSLGGYVIVRAQSLKRASYLFFMGAFNSRMHKHSDDLSLTWYENCQILCDPGKYAYGDTAEREYCVSTRAHNTLEIDDLNTHELSDANKFIPYGSRL